jgi:hypothetical protein
MLARRLLALSILAIAFACAGNDSPTAPGIVKSVPLDTTAILSDGAHGGNPDFFFLPPLVPPPFRNANFELGKFNNTLKPSLRIEICELSSEALNALPKTTTACAGPPIKTFAPGSVQLVNLPLRQNGWWSFFQLPPDGFYYVLWDTRLQPGLVASKYYRIKVLLAGSTVPIGYADVDPMSSLREWRFALTGDVVQLVNGTLLPIPFRVENGALCGGAISCTSETVGNTPKVVQLVGNDGIAIAGASFPKDWLPPGIDNVVVTISSVSTGPDNPDRTEGTRCHANLDLQQFRSCFKFTTTPEVPIQDVETGRRFMFPVTVAVCYILQDSEDPREKFAELYASGPNERPHALKDASDLGILGATDHNCATNTYGVRSSNPLVQLASAGWSKLKGELNGVFGVKTAYAVDVGLGGLLDGMSNVGPAVTAHIERSSVYGQKLGYGEVRSSAVRLTGTRFHNYDGTPPVEGIQGIPVTFTVSTSGGGLNLNQVPGTDTELKVTSTTVNNPFIGVNGDGFAQINWTMPSVRGIHTLTATSPAFNSPITFADTVRGARLMVSMQTGATYQIVTPAPVVNTWVKVGGDPSVTVSPAGLVTAVVGGENINGGNAVTLTSTVDAVEAHSALVNSFAFDLYPRTTTLVWAPVAGAVSYDVVTEFGGGVCSGGGNCTTWATNGQGTATTAGLSLTFGFVGEQPGRWHVTAKDASGNVISTSAFVYFGYII